MNIKAYGICLYQKNRFSTKILLCKAITSENKWGFLKGCSEDNETSKQTAIREFQEESSISIPSYFLEEYFKQTNKEKDIGIFLVNYDRIVGINKFFAGDKLLERYLSWENSQVKFFDIEDLPKIKKKQTQIAKDIADYLKGE